MKNKTLRTTNHVDAAAPSSVWGKGCAGKGGRIKNFEIPDWMFKRELEDLANEKEGGEANA